MGVTLALIGSGVQPDRAMRLCTNRGFDQIAEWMASLPRGKYPAVDAFADHMEFEPTDQLAAEMNDAQATHPPTGENAAMVELLLERLGAGYPGEVAEIDFG